MDTVSELFGIFDGTSALAGRSENFELFHKKGQGQVRLNGDLQIGLLVPQIEHSQMDELR